MKLTIFKALQDNTTIVQRLHALTVTNDTT